jgi:hypothetical protein
VVRIRRSAQVDTVVRFYVPGTYVLRLTAFDGSATRSDDVVVTVLPFSPNGAPDPPEAVAHGRGPDRR